MEGRQDERMGGHEAKHTHPSSHCAPSVPLSGQTFWIFGTKDFIITAFFKQVRYFRETLVNWIFFILLGIIGI